MKKVLLFMALAVAVSAGFTSCSDDDDDNNGNGSIKDGEISGQLTIIEEAYDSDLDEYRYVTKGYVTDEVDEIAMCEWSYDSILESFPVSNGKFTIKLPTSLDSKYLYNIAESIEEEYDDEDDVNFTVSDKDANMGEVWFSSFKNEERNGHIERGSLASYGDWDGYVAYVYADRDVTIKGSYKEEEKYEGISVVFISEYDVKLKKGWNTIVTKATLKESGTAITYTEKSTANSNDSGMLWTVEFYGNSYAPKSPTVGSEKTKRVLKPFLKK